MAVIVNGLTLAGAKDNGGTGGRGLPVEGFYQARITETALHTKEENGEQKTSVRCQLVFEGEYEGAQCRINLGLDFSKAGNRNSWFTVLKSVGHEDSLIQQLADGRVFDGIDTGAYLDGRVAHIWFAPKDETAGRQWDDKKFITREQFIAGQQKAVSASTGAATQTAAPAMVVTSAPAAQTQVAAAVRAPVATNGAQVGGVPFAQPQAGSGALRSLMGAAKA